MDERNIVKEASGGPHSKKNTLKYCPKCILVSQEDAQIVSLNGHDCQISLKKKGGYKLLLCHKEHLKELQRKMRNKKKDTQENRKEEEKQNSEEEYEDEIVSDD